MPSIPAGYVNVQLAGSCASGQEWLIACGSIAEDWAPEDVIAPFPGFLQDDDFFQEACTDNFVAEVLRVQLGTSDPSAPITFEWVGSVAGQIEDAGDPSNCYLVKKSTLTGGRKGKGRTYFPGVAREGMDGAGLLVGDIVADPEPVTGFWNRLLNYLGLGDPYLLHTDPDDDPSQITAFTMDPRIATQRGRLRS